MRKIIFQMMTSVDGFFEGPGREIDWHLVEEEFNNYAIDLLNNTDHLIFGRVTYELMANYWPTETAIVDDPMIAERMNSIPKLVFSRTLQKADWTNTRIAKDTVIEEMGRLKQLPGKDITIFGSSDLALTFIQHNLIDEYRIAICPLALGKGKTLFNGLQDRLNLKLSKMRTFSSGVVLLYYQSN